jgi:hypothetical protein
VEDAKPGDDSAPCDRAAILRARRDDRLSARITGSWKLAGVRAGSGLVWSGSRLLIAQDDVAAVALVDPATLRVETILIEGEGLARDKASKPDFEAAFEGHDRALYLLGSGSSPRRRGIVRIDEGARRVRRMDAAPLFEAMEARIGSTPNIEGAVLIGSRLRLFHRGAGNSPNRIVDVDSSVLTGGAAAIVSSCVIDCGRAADVPLTLTDATPLHRGAILYLAVAEDTPNAIDDGPVTGAAVGVIADADARFAPLVERDGRASIRKAEGIAMDPTGRTGWLITDADDPGQPSELCRLELTGPWSTPPETPRRTR